MGLSQKLQKLEKAANSIGYIVTPGRQNECRVDSRVITINTRQSLEKRAWALAHELGHAKTYKRCMEEVGERACTHEHEWPSLEWELRAWAVADKLLRKLNLFTKEYMQWKHACLRSYYS